MMSADSLHSNTNRAVAAALLVSNAVSLCAIYLGVRQYPPFWSQAGAWVYVCEPVAALLVYSGLVVWLSEMRGNWWQTVLRIAAAFGIAAAAIDLVGLILEDGIVVHVHGPAMQITTMLTLFTLWGMAGWRAARALNSMRAGLVAAVLSAGVCMMVAVAAALIVQLFLVRPSLADVATWGEFKRSGWTNPRAFAIANTLDSGFTHFLIAPVVASVTGGIGSILGRYVQPLRGKPNCKMTLSDLPRNREMQWLWCWRCKCDMPMLDEDEYAEILQLYRECARATKEFRQRWNLPLESVNLELRFRPLLDRYEEITGYRETNHNAIMHHRLSRYGPPCRHCGKPLRTPQAKLCGACMFPVA